MKKRISFISHPSSLNMVDRAGFEPAIYGLKDRRLNLTWLPTETG